MHGTGLRDGHAGWVKRNRLGFILPATGVVSWDWYTKGATTPGIRSELQREAGPGSAFMRASIFPAQVAALGGSCQSRAEGVGKVLFPFDASVATRILLPHMVPIADDDHYITRVI